MPFVIANSQLIKYPKAMRVFHVLCLNFILVAFSLFAEPPKLNQILDKCIRPWQELNPDRQPLFIGYLKKVEGFWFMHKDKIYFSKKPMLELQKSATRPQPSGKLVLPEDETVVKVIYLGDDDSNYRLSISGLGNGPGWEPKKADLKSTDSYLTGKHVPINSTVALSDFQKASAKETESFVKSYVWALSEVEKKRGGSLGSKFEQEYEQRLLVKLGTESPETIFSQIDACLWSSPKKLESF